MIKRCQTCSSTIDSGIICDDCYKPNLLQIANEVMITHAATLEKLIDNPILDTKKRLMTLSTDSAERKNFPVMSGCLKYFPAALAGVAEVSKVGNDKHNPGEPMHHAREKSMDHGDCIVRHLMDTEDLLSALSRGNNAVTKESILLEVNQLVWRSLAYSQLLHESFGAPMAPNAKGTKT